VSYDNRCYFLIFDISSTVTVCEHRNFFILNRCSSSLKIKAYLLSPEPVLILRFPLFLPALSNTRSWLHFPSMSVISREMLGPVWKTACFRLSVFIYLIWVQSHKLSMFVIRLAHPQAEDAPSSGDRLPLNNTTNTLHNSI
jgi:hypothetical protein